MESIEQIINSCATALDEVWTQNLLSDGLKTLAIQIVTETMHQHSIEYYTSRELMSSMLNQYLYEHKLDMSLSELRGFETQVMALLTESLEKAGISWSLALAAQDTARAADVDAQRPGADVVSQPFAQHPTMSGPDLGIVDAFVNMASKTAPARQEFDGQKLDNTDHFMKPLGENTEIKISEVNKAEFKKTFQSILTNQFGVDSLGKLNDAETKKFFAALDRQVKTDDEIKKDKE